MHQQRNTPAPAHLRSISPGVAGRAPAAQAPSFGRAGSATGSASKALDVSEPLVPIWAIAVWIVLGAAGWTLVIGAVLAVQSLLG